MAASDGAGGEGGRMAMPKKGSRRIVVDGQPYRWRVPRAGTYPQLAYGTALALSVEHAGGGAVLMVVCAGARHGNWANAPGTTVTPGRIAGLIRRALVVGWVPTAPGPAFYMGEGDPMDEGPKRDLLARLARLGPLAGDGEVNQGQLDELSDVLARIELAPPDPDYVRPLLGAFGYGDGFGLYAHGANALLKQDRDVVVAAALDALESGPDGPRQWAMETLRRMREKDRGSPPPSGREVRLAEAALSGPALVAEAAVYWAYWVGGETGRRLLDLASRSASGEAKARAAELLAE
jgi:hypothetical protein